MKKITSCLLLGLLGLSLATPALAQTTDQDVARSEAQKSTQKYSKQLSKEQKKEQKKQQKRNAKNLKTYKKQHQTT